MPPAFAFNTPAEANQRTDLRTPSHHIARLQMRWKKNLETTEYTENTEWD
jgi:hypothetical protein